MDARPLAAVVLAAGQGKRMGADVPKVLVEACGRSLVGHVLEALRPLGAQPVVIVHGFGGDAVRQALAGNNLSFAHQPEQNGTGHAVSCALPELGDFSGDVLVLCGDTPLLTTDVLCELVADHRESGRALTVLSAEVGEPGSLGRMLRGADGKLAEIKETSDASEEELAVCEVNTGVMVISSEQLASSLAELTPDNAQGELYLTDVPKLLLQRGLRVNAYKTTDAGAALGVNEPSELAEAVRILRSRYLDALLSAGVRIEDPETVRIDAGVEIGADTVVKGHTTLGPNLRVGAGCEIGPHATLGSGTVVGEQALLGSHVEILRSVIEDRARVPGPARLVDAAIGREAYIGPGTVTADEGGGRIVIGEGAHIGAGVVLEAPVTVGERARVEAGTVLTRGQNIPAGD